MNDLTIGGFVMRTIEEIKKDIEQTREHLHALYEEEHESLTQYINIDKDKYYVFYDPDDKDIMYTGKVLDYCHYIGCEYQFEVAGIQENLCDIQDSCWAGFDAMYVITVRPEKLNSFLDNFTEITKEEFDKKVNDWCANVKKWIGYWLSNDE